MSRQDVYGRDRLLEAHPELYGFVVRIFEGGQASNKILHSGLPEIQNDKRLTKQ